MDFYGALFVSMVLFCFAVLSIILGVLMTYVGKSRTRTFGVVLLAVGVVAFAVFWLLYSPYPTLVFHGIVSLVGAVVGIAIAVVLFLVGFMLT